MTIETDICTAVVEVMKDNPTYLTMLGTSADVHVERADEVDATIVRGGLGRCLVRPSEQGASVIRSTEDTALVTYRVDIVFDVFGGCGQRLLTRSAVQRAMISLFGDEGADLMAELGAQTDRLGYSGRTEIESIVAEPTDDPRKPRIVATLAVSVWHAIPETV